MPFLADGKLAGQLAQPTVDGLAERLAHLGDNIDDVDDVPVGV